MEEDSYRKSPEHNIGTQLFTRQKMKNKLLHRKKIDLFIDERKQPHKLTSI